MATLKVSQRQIDAAKWVISISAGSDEQQKAWEIILRGLNHGVVSEFNAE